MLVQLLKPEFDELIQRKDWVGLKEILTDLPPADIAELLVELEGDVAVVVFRLLKNPLLRMFLPNSHQTKVLPFWNYSPSNSYQRL